MVNLQANAFIFIPNSKLAPGTNTLKHSHRGADWNGGANFKSIYGTWLIYVYIRRILKDVTCPTCLARCLNGQPPMWCALQRCYQPNPKSRSKCVFFSFFFPLFFSSSNFSNCQTQKSDIFCLQFSLTLFQGFPIFPKNLSILSWREKKRKKRTIERKKNTHIRSNRP